MSLTRENIGVNNGLVVKVGDGANVSPSSEEGTTIDRSSDGDTGTEVLEADVTSADDSNPPEDCTPQDKPTVNSQNQSAVDTMLTAAKVAAAQYRETHSVDALTVITPDGVRVAPVMEAMHMIAQAEINMSDNDREKWNANTGQLHAHVLNDPNNLWFATKRSGNIDIWQSSLAECKELMSHLSSSQTRPATA